MLKQIVIRRAGRYKLLRVKKGLQLLTKVNILVLIICVLQTSIRSILGKRKRVSHVQTVTTVVWFGSFFNVLWRILRLRGLG